MPQRCVLVLRGESFRLGGHQSRVRGISVSIPEQLSAAKSHIRLCKRIQDLGYIPEVVLTTYTTEYDMTLAEIYHPYLYSCKFFETPPHHAFENIRDAIEIVDIDRYDCVITMRVDIELKDEFIERFAIDNKIVFVSVWCYSDRKTYVGNPRVNDVFMQFPKNYFNILQDAQRKPVSYYQNFFDYLPVHRGQYRMMTDQYYNSDTSKDRNPLYRIVNRPENESTLSAAYEFPKDF